jgi:hypothetical protein
VSFFAAVGPILDLIASETDDSEFERARPYLEPLEELVGGTKKDGDRLDSRFRITIP